MNHRTLRLLRIPAAVFCGALLAAIPASAQLAPNEPASPYGGSTVEDIIARVNDQIITSSDYDRAEAELEQEDRQRGDTMQQIADDRQNLLRNLIDEQLWLSKGKELGITGDTELIKRLDDIRKQYNMASIDDLEKAAQEQGYSFEDFKQNIRNQIIREDVMRQEVGEHIQFTPGEARAYYEQHAQDYQQPESVRLSEILISTPADANGNDDPAKVAAAKAKADDIEARLHSGGDFAQLARSFSDGPTAAQGGDLGQFRRGALAKVLEDSTFSLKTGEWTQPIRTKQGWIILKDVQHTQGGVQPYNDVQDQVEQSLYMSRMEPAIRDYLTRMREEAFIDIKPGYADAGASPNETKPVFSAYVPPSPKKKAKVERTRYRETPHNFRNKSGVVSDEPAATQAASDQPATATTAKNGKAEKPGKKEKIRFGQAPRETLPTAAKGSNTENAGALPDNNVAAANEPANPLEPTAQTKKTRFSEEARNHTAKKKATPVKVSGSTITPEPPDAAEVADKQTQSAPLGLGGNTATPKKKKKKEVATGPKTRMAQEKKQPEQKKPVQMTPAPQEPGAPAPAPQAPPQGQTQQQ
jgi:peptidyl-prolyl cis-trans isomerase SurA